MKRPVKISKLRIFICSILSGVLVGLCAGLSEGLIAESFIAFDTIAAMCGLSAGVLLTPIALFVLFSLRKRREKHSIQKEIDRVKGNLAWERSRAESALAKLQYLREWETEDFGPGRVVANANQEELQRLAKILDLKEYDSEAIVERILKKGSNTIAIWYRKIRGEEPYVGYLEIVSDVAKALKVEITGGKTTSELEQVIIRTAFGKILDELDEDQKKELILQIEDEAKKHGKKVAGIAITTKVMLKAKISGFGLYVMAATVASSVSGAMGATLPFAFYAGMSKVLSIITGPVGWSLLALWGIKKLSDPDIKSTVEAVLIVAMIRARLESYREEQIESKCSPYPTCGSAASPAYHAAIG